MLKMCQIPTTLTPSSPELDVATLTTAHKSQMNALNA